MSKVNAREGEKFHSPANQEAAIRGCANVHRPGARWWSVQESLDTATPMGRLIATVLVAHRPAAGHLQA